MYPEIKCLLLVDWNETEIKDDMKKERKTEKAEKGMPKIDQNSKLHRLRK